MVRVYLSIDVKVKLKGKTNWRVDVSDSRREHAPWPGLTPPPRS